MYNSYDIYEAFMEYSESSSCDRHRVLLSASERRIEPEIHLVNTATIPSCFSVEYMDTYNGPGNRTTSLTTTNPVVSTRCVGTRDLQMSSDKNQTDSSYDVKISYLHEDGVTLRDLFDFRTLVNRVSNFSGLSSAARGQTVYFPAIWTAAPDSSSNSLIGLFPQSQWYDLNEEPPLALSWPSTQPPLKTTHFKVSVAACTILASWNTGEIQLIERFGTSELRTVGTALSTPHNPRPLTLDVSNIEKMKSPEFMRDLIDINPAFDGALSELLVLAITAAPSQALELEQQMPPDYDERKMSTFHYTTVIWGYGYGNRSTSVWLAMAVMVTYCVITVAYIAYILVTGSTSTAWNSAIELVALALQSKRPDNLGNTAVGLDALATFKEGVGIRVNQDNELELVFAHDRDVGKRGLRKIERNKEY
jgi:hypothetical protein